MIPIPSSPFAIAILRGHDRSAAISLTERCLQAGISHVEVPMQGPAALVLMSELAARFPQAMVGAGTVISQDQVSAAVGAGARFLFAPNVSTAISQEAQRYGVRYIPGVATPSEAAKAAELGWVLQKMFPASLLTPDWLTALHAPLPRVRFVATGGVDANSAEAFLRAGAVGLGLGSCLNDPKQLDDISVVLREWSERARNTSIGER